jgi:hypothetical protein
MIQWNVKLGPTSRGKHWRKRKKALEEKMDHVIWKMNLIIVAVVCVVFGCLLRMYAAKK